MNYYNQIKEELLNNEIYKKVKDYSKNKNDLITYYNVGKLIVEAQGGETRAKYGDNLIKEYSLKLTKELGKGYSVMNLKNMRKFYLFQKRQTVSGQLSWSHYIELLSIDDINEINYYINICEQNNLSVRQLRNKIKNNEYERLPDKTKNNLIKQNDIKIQDMIKNPIIIKNTYDKNKITEKMLQQLILEDINNFLEELGQGFCYIKNEYPIKIGNAYNYIDLLLFNYIFNCFVVVELKITKLKKEHIGQVQVYMNYIDKHIKKYNQNKTIGIIICKDDNSFVMKYCSDNRILKTTYILN